MAVNESTMESAWRAPTTEEAKVLKENTQLYKSNEFRLKVEALIASVRPKQSHLAPLERFLVSLRSLVLSLPPVGPENPIVASRSLLTGGVAVPYPNPLPTEETNWKVAFEAPVDVKVVGSWANKCAVLAKDKGGFTVDLAFEMPSTLFQEKDYLNSRFFHKRAFYLAVLAASISDSKLGVQLKYESIDGDIRRTVLVIQPTKDVSENDFTKLHASVRILPTLSADCPIPLRRLAPSQSNLRYASSQLPTPRYNHILLQSYSPVPHLLNLYTYGLQIPALADAVTLLRVWANQRGFGRGEKTVMGFEALGDWWAFLFIYLVGGPSEHASVEAKRRKPIGKGLSSYQLFRAALDFLSRHNFSKEAVFLKSSDGNKFDPTEYHKADEAVFVDPSSTLNMLNGVPLSSLELLKQEAAMSLGLLDDSSDDPFEALFMRDLRGLQARFDLVIRVDISTAKPRTNFTSNIHDYPSSVACSIESVASIVRQALGTRARLVAVVRQSSSLRDITASHPSQTSVFHLGIILDPSQATRLVDHGPSAEDADGTEKFRELWGDVAELRRFKDGSILESVVWDCPNAFVQRNDIPGRIVEHILKRHFNIDPTYVTVYNRMYDSVLTMPADITRAYLAATDAGTSGFRSALNAYDSLVKTLQAMELPLSLQSLSPSAEGLRQSSVFPPMPLDLDRYSALPHCANFVPTMDFILQFEKSSKWPDDLRAIQKVKLAFFETIAQSLQKQFPDATISIRIDNSITELADNSSLEILLSSGFAFRGMIHHDRELILLERTIGDAVGTDRREREFAINLHKSRFRLSPRHHAAIAALNHRYPSFSLATRLVKRWFSAHYVAPHIPTEMLELLCASIYLNVGPNGIPKSGPTAFAQTIKLLQEWSWRERPLLVPLYSATAAESDNGVAFPSDKKVLVEDAFKATRIRDPTMARSSWIIATEEDIAGEAWGITEPGWFVAQRVTQLAKASWECIEIGISAGTLNVPALFDHPLGDYDFLINLDPSLLPQYSRSVRPDQKVWSTHQSYINIPSIRDGSRIGDKIRLNFDPAEVFFSHLQRVFGNSVMFFYDPLGGSTIGGVWNPLLQNPRPFKVFSGFSGSPDVSKKTGTVSFNQDAVLAEIHRLGSGLVKCISKK